MNDSKVFRWTGAFGVAGFVVFLLGLPLYYLGGQEPPIQQTALTGEFVTRTGALVLWFLITSFSMIVVKREAVTSK
jgi:hypothetical protein